MNVRRGTRMGIIILIIGLSILASTIYRSNSTYTFGTGGFFPIQPHSYRLSGVSPTGEYDSFLWPHCNLRMEITANSTVDVYILDSKGITLWIKHERIEPLWTFEKIEHEVYTLNIPKRGEYAILTHNPTDSPVICEKSMTLYGYEKDLLWASMVLALVGSLIIVVSQISQRKKGK